MALRHRGESPRGASPGDILEAVHEFEARSNDELSLTKGDRIELIERDDDFGDGWYLGKHMGDGRTGLFPEVYTKKAAPPHSQVITDTVNSRSVRSNSTPNTQSAYMQQQTKSNHARTTSATETPKQVPQPFQSQDTITPQHLTGQNLQEQEQRYQATPPPLNTSAQSQQRTVSAPNTAYPSSSVAATAPTQRSISLVMENGRAHEEDSPMLNETLSVIDEHITDMNTPRSSVLATDVRGFNDSGSEYSSHIGHRMSYINGNETDEEERNLHNRAEVSQWTPEQVAEYLEDVGVEARHCEVFKEQEISGEVILDIDQATLFMKEFDLGPVGRRLRTWHKIRALQEEVQQSSPNQANRRLSRQPQYDRHASYESLTGSTSQASYNSSIIPRISGMSSSPATRHLRQGSPLAGSTTDATQHLRPGHASIQPPESPGKHLSAIHSHSRRHSSVDFGAKAANDAAPANTTSHTKKPSFDRNWTMGNTSGSPTHTRTSMAIVSSSLGMSGHAVSPMLDTESNSSTKDLDRGYFSGTEGEGRKLRNVLRKRESASAAHSRQSSATTSNAAAANKRHSRFGSTGSIGKAIAAVASGTRARSQSRSRAMSTNASQNTAAPQNDHISPIVTHLEYSESPTSLNKPDDISTKQDGSSQRSLAQSNNDKSFSMSPTLVSSPKDSAARSSPPSRTTSTATSGASKSMELDKSSTATGGGVTPTSGTKRGKTKKQTSAYTRGLLKQAPKEAMLNCDYSGWMKKKSPSLIATWKPRLFVLRGRRLSYYYTENDVEEQGLIDISNHKVLPADDLLTGIHATVTGAKSTPTSPANAHTETKNDAEVAAQADSTLQKPGGEGIFIFKLIPPRAGLSRAVNFTKPTVHYFAVDNIKQGRLWMAALMKATIEKDDSKAIVSTYSQKTISLAKAKQMRQRPPALMNVDEDTEPKEPASARSDVDDAGLNIQGLNLSYEYLASEENAESNGNGRPASDNPTSAPLPSQQQFNRPASVDRPQTNSRSVAPSSLRMVRSHSGGLSRDGTDGQASTRTASEDHSRVSVSTENTT